MNAIVKSESAVPALAMSEGELIEVLQSSLYPGAKPESIKLVVGYCRAAGLDPMQKPVHIVPMSVKTGLKKQNGYDEYAMRDVIMPGIGLYRTQASRTGEYAGCTEPEFGPTVEAKIGEVPIRYPEWCRVTVRRALGGRVVDFTAKEFWLENYATKSRDSSEPNAMWKKRPFGQLAKCAEAQALRKAFPELGSAPTADEMEGKIIEADAIEGEVIGKNAIQQPRSKSEPAATQAPVSASPGDANMPSSPSASAAPKPITTGQCRILRAKLKQAGLTDLDLKAKFGRGLGEGDVMPDEGWSFEDFAAVTAWIAERAA